MGARGRSHSIEKHRKRSVRVERLRGGALSGGTARGCLAPRQRLLVVGLAPRLGLGWAEGSKVARRSGMPDCVDGRCPAHPTGSSYCRRVVVRRQDQVPEVAQPADEHQSNEHRCDHPQADHVPSLQARRRRVGDGSVSGRWLHRRRMQGVGQPREDRRTGSRTNRKSQLTKDRRIAAAVCLVLACAVVASVALWPRPSNRGFTGIAITVPSCPTSADGCRVFADDMDGTPFAHEDWSGSTTTLNIRLPAGRYLISAEGCRGEEIASSLVSVASGFHTEIALGNTWEMPSFLGRSCPGFIPTALG